MNLDDLSAIRDADPSGALHAAEGAAEQWAVAVQRMRSVEDLPTRHGINRVVFCGMGGSGIAGDVLEALATERSTMPVSVVKGYTLPAAVGPNTVVICASYSGITEETLACFDEAVERKARIVPVTTGGALAERAAERGIACLPVQSGLQPRAALPSLLVPVIVAMERLGVLPDMTNELDEAQQLLAARARRLGRDVPAEDNEAKSIATQIHGKLPLIWGQVGFLSVAAYRWRCQINENAKQLALWSALPELNHNEIVGFEPGAPSLEDIALVVLRAPSEHERVTKRIEITVDEVRDRVGAVIEATATGDTTLGRLMSSCILGDFVSVYLAYLRGVDPTPVETIQRLKARLGD